MPNTADNVYGLTTLCPIRNDSTDNQSYVSVIRHRLHELPLNEGSFMAKVPNTYLCRLLVLDDVFYQGKPAALDRLASKYLIFNSNFYGDRDPYLRGMWDVASDTIREIWEFCVGFDQVKDASSFVDYIKKCQVKTTFLFNGSTDDELAEQLKSLYLKQEFSEFAFQSSQKDPAALQKAFSEFVARVQPDNLAGPTWMAGAARLEDVVVNND
jgi:hypothetical protein